jgi:hypothetical protein
MRIALAVSVIGLVGLCGCDPGYGKTIWIRVQNHAGANGSLEESRGSAMLVVDRVAGEWCFQRQPDQEGLNRESAPEQRHVLRRYHMKYQPHAPRNWWRSIWITAGTSKDGRQSYVRVSEFVTANESPRFRRIFSDLKRRLVAEFGAGNVKEQ